MRPDIFKSSIWLSLKTVSGRLAFVLFTFFMLAGSAQATNYMAFGAECAPPTTACIPTSGFWTGPAPTPLTLRGGVDGTLDSNIKHSGNKSLKIVVNALGTNESKGFYPWDDTWTQMLYFPGTFLGLDVYYRWWMRIEPGFDWGDGQRKVKITRFSSKTNNSSSYVTGYISNNEIYLAECLNTGYAGNCVNNLGQPAEDNGFAHIGIPFSFDQQDDGQWHEYIWRLKINSVNSCTPGTTCDSITQFWVDGISQGINTGWKFTTDLWGPTDGAFEHFGGAMINPYFQLGSSYAAGGTMYLDDWSMDSVYNSIFSGGDTTPPTAPTGLGVN